MAKVGRVNPVFQIDEFWAELDYFRKELRKKNDYPHLASVSFYVGRGVWNISVNGILTGNSAERIRRRAKKFFPEQTVIVNHYMYYTVRIYF